MAFLTPNRETSLYLNAKFLLAFALILNIILHLPLSVLPLGRDQGIWIAIGQAINHGSIFFKDISHFNLPGLGLSFAFILNFVQEPATAVMTLNLLGSSLTIIGLYLFLNEVVNQRTALIAALLYAILWPSYINFWLISQKDVLAIFGIFISSWLVARSEISRRYRHISLLTAGFFVGISIMFKPIFAITGFLLAIAQTFYYIGHAKKTNNFSKSLFLSLIADLFLLLIGALIIAAGFIYYLYQGDAFDAAYFGLLQFAPWYSGFGGVTNRTLYALPILYSYFIDAHYLTSTHLQLSALVQFILWSLFFSVCIAALKKLKTTKKYWLLIPILTAAISYLIQGKGFDYHLAPWQACIVIFIAIGIDYVLIHSPSWKKNNQRYIFIPYILGITILFTCLRIVFATQLFNAYIPNYLGLTSRHDFLQEYYQRLSPAIPQPLVSEKTAQWIKSNSSQSDLIFIWGQESQLYVLSNRRHATAHMFDFMLSADISNTSSLKPYQDTLKQQFILDLKKQTPKFIIVTTNDGNVIEPEDSDTVMYRVPGFTTLLENDYFIVKNIERFTIYQYQPSTDHKN